MKENTAKNFVIQLGSLVALYVTVSAILILIFGVINLRFPDEAASYWEAEGAREGIRASIAMLIVIFPTYLLLTRIANQTRRKEQQGTYAGITKWLVYLSLLIGGAIILGDLVTIINYFLNGEITTRFILKALSLLVIVGFVFGYYLLDIRGYFKDRERESVAYGGGALVLVAIALLFGFMHIETPAEVREMRLDDQQVQELQDMQFRIEEYYRVHETLPGSLQDVYGDLPTPVAPADREPYEYNVTSDEGYQLCATFAQASTQDGEFRSLVTPIGKDNYSWDHAAGRKCFERVAPEMLDRA